jgi:hypothetical protein
MSMHTHHEIEELLGAYALDALDDDERALVEAHLVGCPRCRNEVATHRETIVLLANTGADAPEGVWGRISEQLDEAPPELDMARILPFEAPVPEAPRSSRSISVRAAAAMVAVAAAFFAFLGVQVADRDRGGESDAAAFDVTRGFAEAASDPRAEKVSLETVDGGRGAQVVRMPDGTGFIAAHTLSALAPDRTYQLWALRGQQAISVAVLGNDPGTASFTLVGPLDGFAITDEVAPGVDASANKPVAAGFVSRS